MVKGDEYEILPSSELDYLRHEVEKLKKNPLGDTQASVSLLESFNKLNDNVEKLANIFESANAEMVKAYHEKSFQEELRKLRDENAKIARGIVAVAGLVKELEKKQDASLSDIDQFLEEQDAAPVATSAPQMPRPEPDIQLDEHHLTSELQGVPEAPPSQNPFIPQEPERSLTGEAVLPDTPPDEVPPPPPGK